MDNCRQSRDLIKGPSVVADEDMEHHLYSELEPEEDDIPPPKIKPRLDVETVTVRLEEDYVIFEETCRRNERNVW